MHTSFPKLLTVAPLFLFAAIGFAQTSNIEGDVKGPDGQPLVGANIRIQRTDIKQTFNVKTKAKGHFLYANLPTGVYNITVQVDGKDVTSITDYRPRPGENPPIPFDLSKTTAPGSAAASLAPPPGQGRQELTREQKAELDKQQAEIEKKMKQQEEAMAKDKALQDAFNAGMQAKNAKNYPEAIDNLEKASAMAPTQDVVWAQLGEAYVGLGDAKSGDEQQAIYNKGIAAYAKSVEIKPTDANYHNNYALALAKGKKIDEAQVELTKAAQLDPPQAGKYYYNLGAVMVNRQQNDPAEAAFKKATELDPNYADAYFQYALVLMNKVSLDKAGKMVAPEGTTEALQKYLTLKPDGPNAEGAKAILEQLGSTFQTTFERPGAPATKAKQQQQKKSK